MALLMVALFSSVAFPAVVSTLDRLEHTKRQADALRVAKSQLEFHLANAEYVDGKFEGGEAGFQWIAVIQPYSQAHEKTDSVSMLALRRVHVQVLYQGEMLVGLSRYRVGSTR